jgi:hypothetical protein
LPRWRLPLGLGANRPVVTDRSRDGGAPPQPVTTTLKGTVTTT